MIPDGLITWRSAFDPVLTADRLVAAVEAAGMTVVARIDHAGAAARLGQSLRPTEVILFGNPSAGTPLMQAPSPAGALFRGGETPATSRTLPMSRMNGWRWVTGVGLTFAGVVGLDILARTSSHATSDAPRVHYRTIRVGGLDIFYREAGPSDAPTLLLLHGFPTSSHMFRELIPLLARRYRVIAPDYPGFGSSSRPDTKTFAYTFDHLAETMEHFTDALGLTRFALYMQDYGGPVGLRLATSHPERITALIVQNANAYEDGVTPGLKDVVLRAWTDHSPEVEANVRMLFELPATKRQFLEGAPDPTMVSPDAWEHAQWGMDRPGNKDIQFALQANYGSNLEHYEEWHSYFRHDQPPTLVVWGEGDFVFAAGGAMAYRRDLPRAEIHMLNAGHFALETNGLQIARYIDGFMRRNVVRRQQAN